MAPIEDDELIYHLQLAQEHAQMALDCLYSSSQYKRGIWYRLRLGEAQNALISLLVREIRRWNDERQRQTLTAARNGVSKSRAASLRARTGLDAGYSHRRERENAIEELRKSVEQLCEVVEHLLPSKEDLLPADAVGPEVTSEMA
jgi:hypothetical protein